MSSLSLSVCYKVAGQTNPSQICMGYTLFQGGWSWVVKKFIGVPEMGALYAQHGKIPVLGRRRPPLEKFYKIKVA